MKSFSIKIIGIFFAIASLVISCDKVYYYYTTSYVQQYYLMCGINLKSDGSNKITLYPNYDSSVSFLSTGEDKVLYKSICELSGDTSYNSDISLIMDIMTVSCTYPDVSSINVISDSDFDEQHPAGSSLNDCINITFTCAYQYIQSGYNTQANQETKLLSEVTATELLLNTNFREFEFATNPTISDVHTITFSLTTENGNVFEDSVECSF
ncbi:MAG: hypothetical protein R3Y08_04360 [Rikenellaceae bacterium]